MSQDKQRKKNGKFSLSSLQYVFRHIIWPRRKLVIFGVILIIVNRFSRLVLPGSTKYLMDDVIGKGDTDLLKILLLSVGAALFVQAVTSFVLTRLLSVEAQHMISILRVDVQRHVIQLPVRYFDNTKSGELVSRIMLDVEGVRNLIGTGLVQMFGGILTSVVVFFLLLDLSPQLTLYVVVPLAKPALGALAIFTFLGRWRAFLWPLIMTDSDSMMVLPVGLAKLSDLYVNDYGLICAGSVLMLVPMIAVFVFFQRWFISGIQLGAVKG